MMTSHRVTLSPRTATALEGIIETANNAAGPSPAGYQKSLGMREATAWELAARLIHLAAWYDADKQASATTDKADD